ncbi:uncharacterized protein LOC141659471 [Apium graveolens]|uniref:uncharacterized protein LOC141659471 n=1 Tax=Apium graveolens TaxID=4045 RepID=UPI003D79E47B
MAVAAANLSRTLLLSYLSRGGATAAISLRRQKGLSYSLPTQKGHFNFPHLKTTTTTTNPNTIRTISKVCFCTTSGSAPVTDNNVVSKAPDSDDVVSEDDKLKGLGNILDIRVGQIIKIWRHEEADSLYVEEVDVGEAEPRIICSGLVKYIPLENLENRKVVVLANLKPRNMRGVKSSGMLMAASDALHENVELLVPPEGSVPGDRVWFGSEDEVENLPDAASPNQIQKKKIWESVQPHLKSDASCVATLGIHLMRSSAGVVETGSLKNANIS